MSLVVENALIALRATGRGPEFGTDGAVEGRIINLIPDAEKVVPGHANFTAALDGGWTGSLFHFSSSKDR
jgi:hypothetical protein